MEDGTNLPCSLQYWTKILTFYIKYDIIILRYNDIIKEGVSLIKDNKSNRTRQVQFRMDPELFKKLKATIVYDKDIHSMADLFNAAAIEYLKAKETGGKS